MRATLVNVSSRTRRHWAQVTFPRQAASSFGVECTFVTDNGRRFRAVRGRNRGLGATVYRIRVIMDGDEWLNGSLVNQPHQDVAALSGHRWTVDNIPALVPDIGVLTEGNVLTWSPAAPIALQLIETTPAHSRWFLRKLIPGTGLVFEWWADLLHQDPVIHAWGKLVWSDRTDVRNNRSFPGFVMKSGEYFHLDYGRRHGSGVPVRDMQKQWQFVLGTNLNLNDGAGLPLSGRMLSFVGPTIEAQVGHIDLGDMANDDALDFSSLMAAAEGPIVGVCHEWDGSWCAALNVPRFHDRVQARHAADQLWNSFVASGEVPVGWFGTRPVGISRTPGQTGGQEDFGATKGTGAVSLLDPRHILRYQYSVYADLFRGFMHYENGGVPLRLQNHPQWVTWSGATHYSGSVSPDRLGKEPAMLAPGSGYYGYDDQHRSQNNLAAYMALTDDPLTDDILAHQTTTDLASYRMRYPNNGADAARAQGRTAGAWANFAMLTDGQVRDDQLRLLTEMTRKAITNPQFAASRAVAVLANHGPDGRKPIRDEAGNLLPTWCLWEHGLAMVGIYNAQKARPNDNNTREIATRLARTMAQWGCFEAADGWWLIGDMWYRDGQAIPDPLSKENTKHNYGRGDVMTWTFAGVLAASEILPANDPLGAKARACVAYITGGREAANATEAEWWATVRSVVTP